MFQSSPHGRIVFVLMFFVSYSVKLNAELHEQRSLYFQALAFVAKAWFDL
jgi:hypothetical protein